MRLAHLSVINYKNIASCELDFSPKINCFVGKNGMGKTNLLDAIYYLSFCKSHTNPIDNQVIRHGEEFFMLQGEYNKDEDVVCEVTCGVKAHQRKQFKYNKVAYKRITDHIGKIPLVIISPSDSTIINDGSDERRRFMDIVISQYNKDYLNALVHYNSALENRNKLLKMECHDSLMYEMYEETLSSCGDLIYACRVDFINKFIPIFQKYYHLLSDDSELINLTYKSQLQDGNLKEMLVSTRERDILIGNTTKGTHKDDLEMLLDNYQIKRVGSQGQNKTYIIALKLAQFDFLKEINDNHSPILLLDDIFDKLDSHRVENIIHLVAEDHFGQIFISDTNQDHLSTILEKIKSECKPFTIKNGEVSQ